MITARTIDVEDDIQITFTYFYFDTSLFGLRGNLTSFLELVLGNTILPFLFSTRFTDVLLALVTIGYVSRKNVTLTNTNTDHT